MKFSVIVTLKKDVLDPQGKVVQNTLQSMGMDKLKSIRQGKYFEIELDNSNENEAKKKVEDMCQKLLANLIIEDYKVNLVYAHEIIKLFLRELIKNDGSVIFYSSVAAKMGLSFHSSIASSKSAIEGYVKSLSAELAGKTRVNAIRLSLLDTPLSKFIFDNDKSREISLNMQPTNSFINMEDVVSMSLEIAGNKSITGQIITIDGGMSSMFKKQKL